MQADCALVLGLVPSEHYNVSISIDVAHLQLGDMVEGSDTNQ